MFARNFFSWPWWRPAIVCSRGPLSYKVRLSDGAIWRRHVDHLRKRDHNLPEFQSHKSDPSAHLPDFFSESDTTADAGPTSDSPASAHGRSETDTLLQDTPVPAQCRTFPDAPLESVGFPRTFKTTCSVSIWQWVLCTRICCCPVPAYCHSVRVNSTCAPTPVLCYSPAAGTLWSLPALFLLLSLLSRPTRLQRILYASPE